MSERYDSIAAVHYAAFRPPLHRLILERMLRPNEVFRTGLDVGCGTGYSAVALANYCDSVFAVDPSQAMLKSAKPHPKIRYLHGSAEALSALPVQSFEIATFAGSLFYSKTEKVREELLKVCPAGASVLVYDFNVFLDEVMAGIGCFCPQSTSDYDYLVTLSGWPEFATVTSGEERIRLEVTADQMAHLLLADSNRYDVLNKLVPRGKLFELLAARIAGTSTRSALEAQIYYTRYRVL